MGINKVALITGISGQCGSYLAEQLIEKGYDVHGMVRRSATMNRQNIEHLDIRKNLYYGDMTDFVSIVNIIKKTNPDEIYNLAAQSHVAVSWETPNYTAQTTGFGVLNLLEAMRILGSKAKVYQASTSELFSGDPKEAPQNEETPLRPRSPYSIAKLYAHEICRVYREAFGMFIARGIFFNQESERRGENFVTRKIAKGVADIYKGKIKHIKLGNLEAKRDWGYAPEYTDAMYRMMQLDKPTDLVIATGETHTVKEFVIEALKQIGIEDWENYVKIDQRYVRPIETDCLCGDITKAKETIGWEPKVKFKELVKIMVSAEIKNL